MSVTKSLMNLARTRINVDLPCTLLLIVKNIPLYVVLPYVSIFKKATPMLNDTLVYMKTSNKTFEHVVKFKYVFCHYTDKNTVL
jgi:hypothetical protein